MAFHLVELLEVDPKPQLLLSICFLLVLSFLTLFTWKLPLPRKLPPGPRRLPVIGNLHQLLGELPHHAFRRFSDKYGPLVHLQLGGVPALVVSSAEMAQQVLRTHDLSFCSRPSFVSFMKFSYGGLDMGGAPYDDALTQTRKLCVAELLSSKKVESSRPIREEEVGILVSTISRLSSSRPVNLSEMFLCLFNNITRRQVSGRRASRDGECLLSPLNNLLLEMNGLLGGFTPGDIFPSMAWFNLLTGWQARFDRSFRDIDEFLEGEIRMHVVEEGEKYCSSSRDENFISTLLRLQKDTSFGLLLTRDKIKAILVDVFLASSETAMSSLEWAMSELLINPRVMKKAQEEVRRVVGTKDRVDDDDLHRLQYMKLVLKETWRLHPSIPLLIPRACREDCEIGGYDIAAKTWVFVNVWAIGRDPKYWKMAEVFWPERFEDGSVDFRGQHFVLLPFGSGRRMCPGMALGVAGVELALANLLHRFDWETPHGVEKLWASPVTGAPLCFSRRPCQVVCRNSSSPGRGAAQLLSLGLA